MNKQNSQTPNQNWRPHNYIEESRSRNVPRSQNFYSHYPSSQFINDYIHAGYVYPGVLPTFRSGQTPMPPSNNEIVNPLTMLSPEDYAKYYNKMQNYIPPDPRLCIKSYPSHPSFYEHPHPYRSSHYHGMGLQNQNPSQPTNPPIFPHQPYPSNHLSKTDKVIKNKSIIVIESDEQNNGSSFETKKIPMQKKEEKLPIKQVEFEDKRHHNKQEIQQERSETIVRVLPPTVVNSAIKQVQKVINNEQQIKQIVFSPKLHKQSVIKEDIQQIIPIQAVNLLRDQILQQLQTTELPDGTMKIFITYKTLETHSKYVENQEVSTKVFNLLKIYRAIIQFQKQRKYFIEHIVGDQTLKKFNYIPKNKIQSNYPFESKSKIEKIAHQINQNIHLNVKINGNKFTTNQEESNTNKQKQISNLLYPPKTKKISKRQFSDQNSEEVSFHTKSKIVEKEQSQYNPNIICERRLRDRKKKKNKRQKYQKSYSQKYLKDIQKQQKQKVESSKADKPPLSKQNVKVDIQFSQQQEGLIQKIQGWAQRTALAYAIQQKHKKVVKNSSFVENTNKVDSVKAVKKDETLIQTKKYKERSTKASQNEFRSMLLHKIQQEKTKQESKVPNLMTFVTSNVLTEVEKDEFQKQMMHLTKELKNNENHGRIRIGKEYYQAKMPNFIQSQTELALLMKQKRQKLMERKMSVLTF